MFTLLALSLAPSCKKSEPEPAAVAPLPVPAAPVPAAPVPAAQEYTPPAPVPPTPCLTTAECPEGAVCEGEGCGDDTPGTCVGMRPCTRDLRMYCGCDGVTFGSSGSCPGRRFAHRGECP
jgi:hypothetical protein